jgi:ABC-2 type transport system permease protein
MGYSLGGTLTNFSEMYFTGAISYVADEELPTVYVITGHGESELDSEAAEAVAGENISTESLNLLTSDVPDDASAVIINQPTYDISEDEYNTLDEYLDNGGNIILITDAVNYSTDGMPYIAGLAEKMGLKSVEGIVIETSANGYSQYPYNIVPSVGTGGPAALLDSDGVSIMLYGGSHGIVSVDTSSATVYPLLSTTSSSYVKAAGINLTTFEKEDGDTDGPVYLGAASVLTISDDIEAKFTWYSSPNIMSSSLAKGNLEMFCATLNWMCDKETSISIIGREMTTSYLSVTAASATLWSNMMIAVIPLAILIAGFVVWWRRRRK